MSENEEQTSEETKLDGQVEQAIMAMIDQRIANALNAVSMSEQWMLENKNENEDEAPTDMDELKNTIVGWLQNDDEIVSNVQSIASGELEDLNVHDLIDWSDAADNVEDYIDWDDKIRYNIDYSDVASEVSDYIDIEDQIGNSIQSWVSNGCGTVDDVCRAVIERGLTGDDNTRVLLSQQDYNRIMEVVNFIRPEQPPEPTARDLADQLVAKVDAAEAVKIVGAAVISKAQADAQAVVDAATNGE